MSVGSIPKKIKIEAENHELKRKLKFHQFSEVYVLLWPQTVDVGGRVGRPMSPVREHSPVRGRGLVDGKAFRSDHRGRSTPIISIYNYSDVTRPHPKR